MSLAVELVNRYPIISDQISREELIVILSEIERFPPDTLQSVVEFGCYAGTTSLFIRRLLDLKHQESTFHVYDSFEGLPEKVSQDASPAGEQFVVGELASSKKTLLQNFYRASLKPPVIHKGWFSDIKTEDIPDRISFAFLDGDYYESIRDSLKAIEGKLEKPATIVVDDYANEALPGASKAVDEWCKKRGHVVHRVTTSLAIIYVK